MFLFNSKFEFRARTDHCMAVTITKLHNATCDVICILNNTTHKISDSHQWKYFKTRHFQSRYFKNQGRSNHSSYSFVRLNFQNLSKIFHSPYIKLRKHMAFGCIQNSMTFHRHSPKQYNRSSKTLQTLQNTSINFQVWLLAMLYRSHG